MSSKPCVRVFLFGNAIDEWLIPLLTDNLSQVDFNSGVIFVRSIEKTNEYSNFKFLQSPCVPHNTQLIVLPQDRYHTDLQLGTTDSIFIVDVWTYLNSESMETAKFYRQNYPYTELRIIMVHTYRKTLMTDVSNIQDALRKAAFEYKQEGFLVTEFGGYDIYRLFYWENRNYKDMLKRDHKEKLQNNISSMAFNFDLHYEFLKEMLKDGLLQPESLDEFIRYDENVGVSKIKKLADIAARSFFSESSVFTNELYDIFKAYTKDIRVWNENRIFGCLVSILTYHFQKDMKQVLPTVDKNLSNEISYNKFMINTKFNAIFIQQCNIFFTGTAKDITKCYLNNLLRKMEELI